MYDLANCVLRRKPAVGVLASELWAINQTQWVCCTLQQFISIPCTCM